VGGIGSQLREERVRRGLGIDGVEAETRIRAKYLLALEEERFDVLPGPVYARAFLRDYAEHLGLDGQRLVDELNAIAPLPEDVVLAAPRTARRPAAVWQRPSRGLGWAILAVVCVAAVLAVLTMLGGQTASRRGTVSSATKPPAQPSPSTTTPRSTSVSHRFAISLMAVGPCWLQVRAGSATGQLLFVGMLDSGQVRRFRHRRLWIRVGAPWDLIVRAGRRRLALPLTTTGNMLVTGAGITLV
jgi:Helix-turn-helix domain